ncbi:MAG: FIST N-terminal domain-containing protein [Gemmatimonadaceae bacterium]
MSESAVVYSAEPEATRAAQDIAEQIRAQLPGGPPDAMVVFASPAYDQPLLLASLESLCSPRRMMGASSSGEFTSERQGEGLVCVLALRSTDLKFSVGVARELSKDRAAAARAIASSFHGLTAPSNEHRTALVLTDALAGHADDLVDQLTLVTAGKYQFVGGGAGDNAQFRRTQVFYGTEAISDAAVALEILSSKPLGIGVGHGWEPAGAGMRVTESSGLRLTSLNGMPAVEAFQSHAERTGQTFDTDLPIPFFLHNILGIETGAGHRLRVPLSVNADGSVECAAEVPTGAVVHIMRTTSRSAVEAASRATQQAVKNLRGQRPQVALFFDCVATRLRMGEVFGLELQALSEQLGDTSFVGCNTHGQIARAEGQFGGFHNCTAVVCVLPA